MCGMLQAENLSTQQLLFYLSIQIYYRHEERERKAASHVSWWKRLTHATATHTSDGETQSGPEREQLAQGPVADVEAGPAGMSNVP